MCWTPPLFIDDIVAAGCIRECRISSVILLVPVLTFLTVWKVLLHAAIIIIHYIFYHRISSGLIIIWLTFLANKQGKDVRLLLLKYDQVVW